VQSAEGSSSLFCIKTPSRKYYSERPRFNAAPVRSRVRHTKEHRVETKTNFLQTGVQPVSDRMRELLARAAQDHVHEQRSQSQVLDELRQRMEGMEWLLREVRERELSALTGQVEGVRGQVSGLAVTPPPWAQGLAERIDALLERVKPIAELPSLWADVGAMAERVDEGLQQLQTLMDQARHVHETAQQSAERLEEMTRRLDRLQNSMEAASVRFNRLDKALAELGHRGEQLEHAVQQIGGRVERSFAEMAERVEGGLHAVDGRVEGIGGRLDGLDGRLEGLAGRLDGVDDRVESLHERVGQLPAALEMPDVHRRLAELAHRPAADHDHRFDELEKRLSEAVDPLLEELRARPDRDEVKDAMAVVADSAHHDAARRLEEFAHRFEDVQEDVRRRIEAIHHEVTRRVDSALEELTAQVDIVSRRVESVHDDVTKQVEAVHTEVSKQMNGVHDDVARRVADLQEELARQVGGIHREVTARVAGFQEEFTRRVEGVHAEFAQRTEVVQAELGRRFEGVRHEVGQKVDLVHGDVARQVAAVHEDMLRRLTTLEESVLALAEALLRPRS